MTRRSREVRRGGGFAIVLAGALSCATRAQASERDIPIRDAIEIEGGGCIAPDDLAVRLRSWMGSDTIDGRLAIVVRQDEATPKDVSFVIRAGGADAGKRSFAGVEGTCDQLRGVVALAIAVAIDEVILKSAREPSMTITTSVTSDDRSPAEAPERAERTAPPRLAAPPPRVLHADVDAEVRAFAGTLPGVAPGAAIGAALHGERWGIRLGAFGAWAEPTPIGAGSASTRIIAAELDGCAHVVAGRLLLGLCPGIAMGQFRAVGSGFSRPLETTLPWVALAVRTEGKVFLSRDFGISASILLYGHLTRPRLEVLAADEQTVLARESGAASIALGAGPFVRFR